MNFPLFAVHIADAMLSFPWLLAGWVLIGLLVCFAARRIHEDEIPRVALLTAAFFVASSIHVKLGPTSVHLLLNGLVGVTLGRRAPLAILIGITLQALLLAHGGVTTIGVNATVQSLPALAAGGLFSLLRGYVTKRTWEARVARTIVLASAAFTWGACAVLGVSVLLTNPWYELLRITPTAGAVVSLDRLADVQAIATHSITLTLLASFVAVIVWFGSRTRVQPEFAAGTLAGLVGVLGTLLCAGAVLIFDGADRWSTFVSVVFVVHLPLALLEAGIVGVTAGFLARVQPEMIGVPANAEPDESPGKGMLRGSVPPVLAVFVVLLGGNTALAHRLKSEATVDIKTRRVIVESFYETNDVPKEARATVKRADGGTVAEGPLDERGFFRFDYEKAEALTVEVTAPGGHRSVLRLTAEELGVKSTEATSASDLTHRNEPNEGTSRWRDLVIGLAFVLALASFWIGIRNSRTLKAIQRARGG